MLIRVFRVQVGPPARLLGSTLGKPVWNIRPPQVCCHGRSGRGCGLVMRFQQSWNRYFLRVTILMVLALGVSSCGTSDRPYFTAKVEPWRAKEERACLNSGQVREHRFLKSRSSLGGPNACGAIRPFLMSGAAGGRVRMEPAATLRCPMVPHVEKWIRGSVIPASWHHFGSPVVKMHVAASYSCRPRNGIRGGKLSEHGRANALDISSFTLADGRKVTVKKGWRGGAREQAFLRAVHKGGCANFTTVLGPNADRHHQDHFHFDLARHGRKGTYRVCR